jgi:hypothetical protein
VLAGSDSRRKKRRQEHAIPQIQRTSETRPAKVEAGTKSKHPIQRLAADSSFYGIRYKLKKMHKNEKMNAPCNIYAKTITNYIKQGSVGD